MEKVSSDVIFDPRGKHITQNITLAQRHGIESLKKGKILFFDNTKLSFCNYSEIYSSIENILKSHGLTNIEYTRKSVRGTMTAQIRDLAAKLASENYSAAIVALADMGTSVMSTILATELEKNGIPTLLIASPPGDNLAEHVAHYRSGRLCICHLDIFQASTRSEIKEQVLGKSEFIIESLTSDQENPLLGILKPKMDFDRSLMTKGSMSFSDLDSLMKIYEEQSIGDGLPVIPPTAERYELMKSYCPESVDTVLIPEAGPSGKDITIHDVIVNSILAGCEPRYLPIVLATFRAMTHPSFNFQQSITTSYNGGNLVLVSGPIADELNISSGQGCLGPGFRANATIGRAVNLTILNVCRAYPGKADLGCLGSPVEFTYCFAESLTDKPWETLNEEKYDDSVTTVYLMKAEPPTDVVDFLSQSADSLLEVIVDSATHLGRMNAYIPGRILIVLTPDHSKMLVDAGWTKDGLRKYLHEHIVNSRSSVEGKGLVPVRPVEFEKVDPIPATRSSSDIDLVVAGGRGGHSAIIASWGLYCDAVLTPLTLPNGEFATSICDFKK